MHIVLVGAGGTGLSSVGFLFTDLGYTNIIGIDSSRGQITQKLEEAGVQMYYEHGVYHVQPGDVVIYSDACPRAPEVLAAYEHHQAGIKHAQLPYSYFSFLGEVSKYFETIAIAGTHGKSSTTALLTYTLSHIDPDFGLGILGALVPQLEGKNYWMNTQRADIVNDISCIFSYILSGKNTARDETLRKKYRFVIEADEYNRHFLLLDVDYGCILNAELDHSDIYPTIASYYESFVDFAHRCKKTVFYMEGEKGIDILAEQLPRKTAVAFAPVQLDYVFGTHMQKNACFVRAIIENILPDQKLTAIMASWTGLWRRMELLEKKENGTLLYTDYGHHPTEIAAVHEALVAHYPHQKIALIFQPHQARRVIEFRAPFVTTIKLFDDALIYDMYTAREDIPMLLASTPLPHHLKKDMISSADDLGMMFASESDATYTTSFSALQERIDAQPAQTIICVCTAGNLDFKLRNTRLLSL